MNGRRAVFECKRNTLLILDVYNSGSVCVSYKHEVRGQHPVRLIAKLICFLLIVELIKDTHRPTMDIIETPTNYIPHMEKNGTYVDKTPPYTAFKSGLTCLCNARKVQTIFYDVGNFSLHTKCKKHQEWLQNINTDATNYYERAITSEKNVKMAQVLIARKDKEINELRRTISILLERLEKNENPMEVDDLLDY